MRDWADRLNAWKDSWESPGSWQNDGPGIKNEFLGYRLEIS